MDPQFLWQPQSITMETLWVRRSISYLSKAELTDCNTKNLHFNQSLTLHCTHGSFLPDPHLVVVLGCLPTSERVIGIHASFAILLQKDKEVSPLSWTTLLQRIQITQDIFMSYRNLDHSNVVEGMCATVVVPWILGEMLCQSPCCKNIAWTSADGNKAWYI